MADIPRRRIVRRAVMALAAVGLLTISYVASIVCFSYAVGAGWITNPPPMVFAIYRPLELYLRAGYPGSELLQDACDWGRELGQHHRFRREKQ